MWGRKRNWGRRLLGCVAGLLLLCGCTQYLQEAGIDLEDDVEPVTEGITAALTEPGEAQPTKSPVELEAEAYLADKEELAYESREGDHSYFWSTYYTASPDGYYFITEENVGACSVWFYDIATGIAEKFCARPNCLHGRSCDACLTETTYDCTSIFYHEGRVYLFKREEDGAYLVSYAKDATDYRKHGKLWEKDAMRSEENDYSIRCARLATIAGSRLLYFTSEDEEIYRLCSIPLDGSREAEVLTEFSASELTGKNLSFRCVHLQWEDGIFFSVGGGGGSGGKERRTKIIRLYEESGELEEVLSMDAILRRFTVIDRQLYYYREGVGFCTKVIGEEQEQVLYPATWSGAMMVSWDGEYFYLDNGSQTTSFDDASALEQEILAQEILVLDREGALRDRISVGFQFCEPLELRIFGDRRSLFFVTGIGEREKEKVGISRELSKLQAAKYVLRMDKRLIGSGIQVWTAIAPAECVYLIEWTRPDGTVYYFDEEEGMLKQKTP